MPPHHNHLVVLFVRTRVVMAIALLDDWQFGLVTGALIWSIGGTIFLIGLGWLLRLVGVEYDL